MLGQPFLSSCWMLLQRSSFSIQMARTHYGILYNHYTDFTINFLQVAMGLLMAKAVFGGSGLTTTL